MNQYLNDPEYLFSILTALVKKNDGKITITEEELKTGYPPLPTLLPSPSVGVAVED